MYIAEAIQSLLDEHKSMDIAKTLGVSEALVSTWKNKNNDFTPRVLLASKILMNYDMRIFPYDENDLREVAENEALRASRIR